MTKDPTTLQLCPCEMSSVLKAIETTRRQKLSVPLSVTNFFINKQNFRKTDQNANDISDDITKHRQKNK